jgi:hypothetical protein
MPIRRVFVVCGQGVQGEMATGTRPPERDDQPEPSRLDLQVPRQVLAISPQPIEVVGNNVRAGSACNLGALHELQRLTDPFPS